MSGKKTDVPALAGAATAGSISVFMGSGPYSVLSISIGLALLSFICTYSWSHSDTPWRCATFASVFGLLSLLIVAPLIELYLYSGWEVLSNLRGCVYWVSTQEVSLVNPLDLLCVWFVISTLVFIEQYTRYKWEQKNKQANNQFESDSQRLAP